METPYKPSTIECLRTLPRSVLLEMRKQAADTLKLHTHKAQDAFGGEAGYRSIFSVALECAACKIEIQSIDIVLKEWQETLAKGKLISLRIKEIT